MEPYVSLVYGVGTVLVASLAAIMVGRRRGLDAVDKRTDEAAQRLIRDLESRVALLERERVEAAAKIVSLESKVKALEADLSLERAITRRFRLTTGENEPQ